MKKPRQLTYWNFPDTIDERDGYDYKQVPDNSRDNFNILLSEYNTLVATVELIVEKLGMEWDDDEL